MSAIKIKSVKLIDGGEKLKVKFEKSETLHSENEVSFDNVVHPDLIKAMNKLRPHLAVLCGQLDVSQIKRIDQLEKFSINGYHIGGKPEQQGIKIVGGLSSDYGYVGLNSPFIIIESTDESNYPLIKKLNNDIKAVEDEVLLYMSGEKLGAPELFPVEGEKFTSAKVAEPEGVKDDEDVKAKPASKRNAAKEQKERAEKKDTIKKRRGRVAQSAENPSGILDEDEVL